MIRLPDTAERDNARAEQLRQDEATQRKKAKDALEAKQRAAIAAEAKLQEQASAIALRAPSLIIEKSKLGLHHAELLVCEKKRNNEAEAKRLLELVESHLAGTVGYTFSRELVDTSYNECRGYDADGNSYEPEHVYRRHHAIVIRWK